MRQMRQAGPDGLVVDQTCRAIFAHQSLDAVLPVAAAIRSGRINGGGIETPCRLPLASVQRPMRALSATGRNQTKWQARFFSPRGAGIGIDSISSPSGKPNTIRYNIRAPSSADSASA